MKHGKFAVVLLVVAIVAATAAGLGYLAVTIDATTGDESVDEAIVPGDETVEPIHDAGTTGENVSVGVIDVTGFDLEHRALEDRVAGEASFGTDAAAVDSGDRHGTSAAVTVAGTAPDASLYLATFETADDYAAAVEWLLDEDVDVIVAPVSDAGTLGDGTSSIAEATTEATERGTVVVAPAGNLGDAHWRGEYDPDENGVHIFDEGPLNDVTGPPGQGEFHLAWNDPDRDYRLELHRVRDDGTTELVAQSLSRENGNVSSERLTARLADDRYALVVRGPERRTDTRIRVASSTHSLSAVRASGSVVDPAAAPGTISVGSVDATSDEVERYSSRGPTADGRLGVHVVAPSTHSVPGHPPFEGTSASAAYVGGVAALVVDADPDLKPDEVRWTIASTADPVDGVDAGSGHGAVDPVAAVSAASADAEDEST
ncbi:S8 family peptidase [Natrarchaeobius oligotrophus]|uniref:Subtilase n=1 Tax=Natrarchaeobius chitinivorans TaxID=1679083 RepID=A0A3N6MEE6_NATCH|nr:S8 family serine peptidase [Natrarchaeobius chitinivorans]RQH01188.1 subtilase [Natrarchaeobius chitinivorans]